MRLSKGEQVGPYEVVDLLAQGGMGESYHAVDRSSNQHVVLKVPYGNMIGDLATYGRYEREAKIGEKLHHPNIQRFLAAGQLPGTGPFMVLEYVDGESFRKFVDEHKPFATFEAVGYAVQVAAALGHCHEQGIVHRDLKPENLLVTPDGQLKLLDFGIASLQGARRLTWGRLSEAVGTPDYMAPEQIRGDRGDARTDVYALGTMLFEMLAGRVPYVGDDALDVMSRHVKAEAPRLRSLGVSISPELEAIVAKSIRRDADQRYQTMAEFSADLQQPEAVDLNQFDWHDKPEWAGFETSVGGMPSLKTALLLIIGVLTALGLIGVLAQLAPHAAR